MKVKVIKEHASYEPGVHDVTEERGAYLIAVGVAEEFKTEKVEKKAEAEKKEITKPTTKKTK